MPDFIVTSPEGKKFRVSAPEGATQEQVLAYAQSQFQASPTPQESAPSPVEGNSFLENALIGSGKTFTDLGLGIRQRINEFKLATGRGDIGDVVEDREAVAEKRRLDAPVMETGGGKVGAIGTGIATAVPAAFIPGANTVAGAGLTGAIYGALQPSESNAETALNTGLGGAFGAVGQYGGQKLSGAVSRAIANRKTAAEAAKQGGAVRDALVKEARDAGYVIPPSTTNPNALNTVLESIGGKAATQQAASVRNQAVTNNMIRAELGLPENSPITPTVLAGLRQRAGAVYKEVADSGTIVPDTQYLDDLGNIENSVAQIAADFPDANVGSNEQITKLVNSMLRDKFDAKSATEYVKQLRKNASANLSGINAADPAKRALGFAQRDAAATLEDQIMRHLRASGKEALADSFDAARTQIAKTYSVEAALNEATGNVQARQLATQLRKGKPLSGNIEAAAKFAQAFPKAADEITHSPGVSALDAIVGGGGAMASGNPALLAAPLARPAMRAGLLSDFYQNRMLQPSYTPNTGLLEFIQGTANQSRLSGPAGLLAYQNL